MGPGWSRMGPEPLNIAILDPFLDHPEPAKTRKIAIFLHFLGSKKGREVTVLDTLTTEFDTLMTKKELFGVGWLKSTVPKMAYFGGFPDWQNCPNPDHTCLHGYVPTTYYTILPFTLACTRTPRAPGVHYGGQ